ncbi:MAG: hypothetical protein UW09_C0004G0027 [candidate division TM6 bacterium GW2011_GWF2_43_87]|nr:MAG: hypothetical protein UW09_C0004G0027 [candidate division TM6 bacterium GW2011_GWF2_43_87]
MVDNFFETCSYKLLTENGVFNSCLKSIYSDMVKKVIHIDHRVIHHLSTTYPHAFFSQTVLQINILVKVIHIEALHLLLLYINIYIYIIVVVYRVQCG